ncbi:hypothetical protein [Nocardia sp. NPDC002869]|uniref:hypothetical protein n=1 Tax=Nocardia sp. NPDC002869 TaxID=3161032 RepID=UPI00398C9D9B
MRTGYILKTLFGGFDIRSYRCSTFLEIAMRSTSSLLRAGIIAPVARNGTVAMLVQQVRVIAEAIDELDREVSVDSSLVRVHQHAAGAHTRVIHTGGQRVRVQAQRTS